MAKYKHVWTAGLDKEKAEEFEDSLARSQFLLDKLVKICYNMLNESEKQSDDFDSPNWALRQANLVGYRKALTKVISLCEPSKGNDRPQN